MSLGIGQHQIDHATYLADPCPEPSLSASIARELLGRSPRHAWWAHPRLNPQYHPERAERFDIGTAAHALLLEGAAGVLVVDAADWRGKHAQARRAEAHGAGKIPLLAEQWSRVQDMVRRATAQLLFHEPPRPFTAGAPEQTLIWQEGETWCRARLDWMHDGVGGGVDEYKTTDNANPDVWTRLMFSLGFDIQAAWYLRGRKAVTGQQSVFRFVVQETAPPHEVSVIALGPEAMAFAQRKVEHALKVWRECRATNRWPGYPARTCWAEVPAWAEAAWLDRESRDEARDPEAVPEHGGPTA